MTRPGAFELLSVVISHALSTHLRKLYLDCFIRY